MKSAKFLLMVCLLLIVLSIRSYPQSNTVLGIKQIFNEYNIEGCFILSDLNQKVEIKYNPDRCKQGFIPASTFKIFNSLVALETGVLKSENDTIRWDGVERDYSQWNKDMDMSHAFKYSAVWFYQEIARRVGYERMQKFIDENNYGNKNIAGGIDLFWLQGEIQISPEQQIDLLRKLYLEELSFSKDVMKTVKNIMLYKETESYTIRAKTGWGVRFENRIGWFVGYVEKNDEVYFFATNLETKTPDPGYKSRIEITMKILDELGITD